MIFCMAVASVSWPKKQIPCKQLSKHTSWCVDPENIHTHNKDVTGNSEGVGGLNSQIFKGKVWS